MYSTWPSVLAVFFINIFLVKCFIRDNSTGEMWGYQNIREQAYMFWWLYTQPNDTTTTTTSTTTTTATTATRPLLMWLQGGPGASSTGFGNIAEIGPLDEDLNTR